MRRALLLVLLLAGCTQVRPWERELLAKPKMRLQRSPQSVELEQHVYEYREGAAGGYGSEGGGCGCN